MAKGHGLLVTGLEPPSLPYSGEPTDPSPPVHVVHQNGPGGEDKEKEQVGVPQVGKGSPGRGVLLCHPPPFISHVSIQFQCWERQENQGEDSWPSGKRVNSKMVWIVRFGGGADPEEVGGRGVGAGRHCGFRGPLECRVMGLSP